MKASVEEAVEAVLVERALAAEVVLGAPVVLEAKQAVKPLTE